jgi:hypothetical protein
VPSKFIFGLLASLMICLTAASLRAEVTSGGSAGGAAPDFGPNVLVFDPSMDGVQARINSIFATQERGQFDSKRYALLFKPGKYDLDVQVGFYTQVSGLGASPDDVEINGAVRCRAGWMGGNATCNFWRCVENLSVTPTMDRGTDVWAVSQGTALRRVHIKGNINLWDGGWSSGGFCADCIIDGNITSGSQQQWLSRNCDWGAWRGGVWNMVFVGVSNPPSGSWPRQPYTVVAKTPVIREKPYLFIDKSGNYFVMVPRLEAQGSAGVSWKSSGAAGTPIPIKRFYIAQPGKSAAAMNAALNAGMNLLLTPGNYALEDSIRITRPDTVVLGLGYPTLTPQKGTAAITVADVDGVKIGGLLLEAGETSSSTLLQVGRKGHGVSHASDPIFLYDIFARAGGAAAGTADSFITIDARNVIGDNFWLWRADHGNGAGWNSNRNLNGLIVNGDDVIVYGLAVEHCEEYQTLWNGNGGRVYFYQSEMPYDVPSQKAWSHDGERGYASYKVGKNVKTHEAWGLGIYSLFNDAPVIADCAIEAPDAPGVKFHHMITFRLGGKPGSGIAHILDDRGNPVISGHEAKMD